ncbi:MAG: hypothetical protein JSR39_06970, partial [Verrucomicrobia bacterium]|nr:hypothetical protein [Verrucomicrobiota bacterium]
RPLFTLYSKLPFFKGKIVLLTWIISDGWGDLFAQLEAAKVLNSHFPHLDLTLFTLVHKDRTPPAFEHPFEQHWIPYSGKLNGPIVHEAFSSAQLEKIADSDLLIELPTPFPYIRELLGQLKKIPSYVRIGEHSMIDTVHYHPETSARSMGLHFLEKGIFIKKAPKVDLKNRIQLKDQNLQKLLFGSFQDLEHYQTTNRFQIAYTKSFRGLCLYLTALLSSLDEDEKDIDICFFQMDLLAQSLEKKFKDPISQNYPLLKAWNIGELHIYYQQLHSIVPILGRGKRLRLIHCTSLCHDDHLFLTSITDRLIGATGDQSILEAISTGKPVFYDPPHFKRPFLRDLCLIAEKKLGSFPCLAEFFKLCLKNPSLPLEENHQGWVSEEYVETSKASVSLEEGTDTGIGKELGLLLKDPAMSHAFEALRQYLAEAYSIDPILTGLVCRALLIKQNPSLAQLEEEEVQKLLDGAQTLDETLSNIAKTLAVKTNAR